MRGPTVRLVSSADDFSLVVRDRTDDFTNLRNSTRGAGVSFDRDDVEMGLTTKTAGFQPTEEPQWMNAVHDTQGYIDSINLKLQKLKKLHAKHSGRIFADDNNETYESEIELLTGDITSLFMKSKGKITGLTRLKADTLPGQEGYLKDNLTVGLATSIRDLSKNFRRIQGEYLRKFSHLNDSKLDYDEDAVDIGFTDVQLNELEEMENEEEEFGEEIKEIHKSIVELAELFKEMAMLVIDQGSILDRIDFNIEQTSYNTKKAVKQIEESEELQKKTRTKMVMLLLILGIIGLFVILLVRVAFG
eukprot:TRINITY_DN12483_c0_g1_i1.p1 TRINITY_DN12483_c0_g1~~TRINITY_DN12483_c0_g1_i1.p1  ORF type:complete len:303 (-),score=67.91 TRINITY_DN12483_c0_g1_i1:10-918(-)